MVLVLRWVDDNLNAHEDFIGLYEIPPIEANVIVSTIQDALIRMNLKCVANAMTVPAT